MDADQFRDFVHEHDAHFRGINPETPESLRRCESALGFELPPTLAWLLSEYGYSSCCGVDDLAECVERTLACRQAIGLPDNILLLNDWGDAGVVFTIADDRIDRDYAIVWSASRDLHKLAQGVPLPSSGVRFFINFAAWVQDRLRVDIEAAESGV